MRDLLDLPKAHLHVHLEGAVRWSTLREIGTANRVAVPDPPRGFTGFADFFARKDLVRRCLCRPEDFRRVAVEFCADEAAQGTRYAELSFTAAAHGERLGDLAMPLAGVLDGLAEGAARYGVETRVILDHSRRRSVDRAWNTLDLARRYEEVVGIGLAGDEAYPAAPFADVFRAARDAGLHVVHHAGEAAGPDSIREAVQVGHAERIGHGIRVLSDDALVSELVDRRIPLEVCPSSNVALGFVPSLAAHPLPALRDAGLTVTLNTDDPSLVGTSLTAEYTRVRDSFGYDNATLADLATAGVDASYAPEPTKARLRTGIADWLGVSRR
ncbi:MAG: adenosine deaminase [Micromonosporaceae bacterium]